MTRRFRQAFAALVAMGAASLALWSASDDVAGLSKAVGGGRAVQRQAALLTRLGEVSRSNGTGVGSLDAATRSLAAYAPMNPVPFYVAGGIAEQDGDRARADALYAQALRRDPRNIAAHFMLARRAVETGGKESALRHLAAIARLSPGAGPEFARMMLSVVGQGEDDSALRRFLASDPDQRETLFGAMANDQHLAPRLVALAGPRRGPPPPWLSSLVGTLVQSDRVDLAATAWQRYGGGGDPRTTLLRNPTFGMTGEPAPFGWTIASTTAGSVSQGNGALDVEVYGRETGLLLSQWTLLGPGRYRLAMVGKGLGALPAEWRIQCLTGTRATLASAAAGRPFDFEVPDNCLSQSVAMWSLVSDSASDMSARIGRVDLVRLP